MQLINFLFILISAFFHAFYNFLMKKGDGNQFYLNRIFLVAAGLSLLVVLVTPNNTDIPWKDLPYVYIASSFYVLYQVFINKAYEHKGNISTNYPLSVLSPLFIPIWAYFFLGEKISLLSGLGIFITFLGALVIQLKSFSTEEIKNIFVIRKDNIGARFALGASFVYSFGAIFDKFRISAFPLNSYLFFLVIFMSINLMLYLFFSNRQNFRKNLIKNWKISLLGGTALYLSFLTFRIALRRIDVSIASPLRQVSIVFAIIFGVVLLKEKIKLPQIISTILILSGIVLINLG